MRRSIIAAAVVLLACAGAPRLHFQYLPRAEESELAVALNVRGTMADPAEITNRYVVPIEASIRSLGDVTALRTRVRGDGANVEVRLRAGTDADVKAARLASELARIRTRLPLGSQLAVWPSSAWSDEPALVIAFTGARAADEAETLAEAIRGARGARDVRTFGSQRAILDVRLLPTAPESVTPGVVTAELRSGLAPMQLGRRTFSAPSAMRAGDVLIRSDDRAIRLGDIASIRSRREVPTALARVNGKPAVLMSVFRDDEASLFTFDRAVREKVGSRAVEVLWSDADEMRTLLFRAAIAAILASILLGLYNGGLALYLPLATAILVNVARLTDMTIDANVVVLAVIAFAGVAPLAAWRLRSPLAIALFFAGLIPIAVSIVGGSLQTLLRPSAWVFVAAMISAAAACLGVRQQSRRSPIRRSAVANALRNSATIVLAATALTTLLLSYFGSRLDPRVETPAERSRVYVALTLPGGTTLDQTISAVERMEKRLGKAQEIQRFWTFATAAHAQTLIELKPRWQSGPEARIFRTQLRLMLPFPAGMIAVTDGRGRGSGGTSRDIEEQPFTDENAVVYRFLIKGTDIDAIRRTADAIDNRLARLELRRGIAVPEWPAATPVLELATRPTTSAGESRAIAGDIEDRSTRPSSWILPTGGYVRVADRDAPETDGRIPQRADLLSRSYRGRTVAERFIVRTSMIPGGATRELGRFVMPVAINIPGYDAQRGPRREAIDRTLATMPLPAGMTLERPSLAKWKVSRSKLRAFGLAALLPALLIGAAAIVLSSIPAAIVSIAVVLTGVSVTAPLLWLVGTDIDETTLFAVGCAACCSAAAVTALLARTGNRAKTAYRAMRELAVPAVFAAAAGALMLVVIAAGAQAGRDGWRAPLIAAATVLGVSLPAGMFVAPAVGVLWREFRRRGSAEATRLAQPAIWVEGGAPSLAVRNVTKRYAAGFRALQQVSFDLHPGVIGLLGPNGAGKTTLLRILTGLLRPTRGQVSYRGVTINELNLPAYRGLIGFLPQEFNAYSGMTAAAFLDYWALERGIEDAAVRDREVAALLKQVGLEEDANRRVRDFSGGMRQRIGIARALIGDPPLLIVDEPTTGLDLESRIRFRELVTRLGRERIVILSTHIASDVEATATRILLLSRGRLLWDGTPDTLMQRAFGRVFETVVSEAEARSFSRLYRLTYRVRLHEGVRVRGVVAEDEPLPGAAIEATLEEAYLAAMPADRVAHTGAFHFLYA